MHRIGARNPWVLWAWSAGLYQMFFCYWYCRALILFTITAWIKMPTYKTQSWVVVPTMPRYNYEFGERQGLLGILQHISEEITEYFSKESFLFFNWDFIFGFACFCSLPYQLSLIKTPNLWLDWQKKQIFLFTADLTHQPCILFLSSAFKLNADWLPFSLSMR